MKKSVLLAMAALCVLSSCKEEQAPQYPTAQQSEAPAIPVSTDVSAWMGKWNGPEGAFLEISENEIGYKIIIQNLDGPREFKGIDNEGVIEFERDGRTEILRAGDGAATGMKWLADKKSCLVVTYGEGYCRG